MATRPTITYPTQQLLGVVDDPGATEAAVAALGAAGVRPSDVRVFVGEDGRRELGTLGARRTLLSRVVRIFQFMSMDQLPDFLVYERALVDGRAVMAVHVTSRSRMLAAKAVLERHGAHFLNHFGRFMTEELTLWRGPEPEIPGALRR